MIKTVSNIIHRTIVKKTKEILEDILWLSDDYFKSRSPPYPILATESEKNTIYETIEGIFPYVKISPVDKEKTFSLETLVEIIEYYYLK